MNVDIFELLSRLKFNEGEVSRKEVDEVALMLKNTPSDEEVWDGLTVIGLTCAKRHRSIVEQFLFCQVAVFVERALFIVWHYWKDYDLYRDYTLELIRGAAWDSDCYAQSAAIRRVGGYLKASHDAELIKAVFLVYIVSEERFLQLDSYKVLASLLPLSSEEREGPPTKALIRRSVVDKIEQFVLSLSS